MLKLDPYLDFEVDPLNDRYYLVKIVVPAVAAYMEL